MACSMGTSVGYDRARNKVSGGPMAHPLAHCQLESRFQSDTFVSTLNMCHISYHILSSTVSIRISLSTGITVYQQQYISTVGPNVDHKLKSIQCVLICFSFNCY